jgi:hypothetical protein
MEPAKQIPIWFFIGGLVLVYGVLIFGAGVYYLFHQPARPTALGGLHADLWWGALLVGIGAAYCVKYWPLRTDRRR